VTGRPDDDALSWEGDEDPTLDVGAKREPPTLPDGYTAVGKGSEQVASGSQADIDADENVPGITSNVMLVALGILGGVYALFTVGWIIGGLRLQGTAQFLVAPVAFQFALWLAVAAPALWFAATFVLTRASAAWVRLAWLVGGAALLVPWPFIMTGAVGQ
jgi:hypothetical protein